MSGEQRDPFAEARASMEAAETPWESVPPTSEEVQATLLEAAGEVVGLLRSIEQWQRLRALAAVAEADYGLIGRETREAAAALVGMALEDVTEGGAS